MPLIHKLSSGKIFYDDFTDTQLNPIWQVSPSDPTRYSVNQERAGYLRLKHGDTSLYFLMDMPNRDFIMEIKNDYSPSVDKDTAGLVVYRDVDSHIQLLEYYAPKVRTSVNYSHMRIQKRGDVYTGYGSKDNGMTWEIIGSGTAQDMTKVGLVINGQGTGFVDFDVDYVKVFEDNKFIVGNLTPGMKVELLDASDVVKDTQFCQNGQDSVYIDLSRLSIPFNGKIRISESGTVKETSPLMEIWGGDVFWYGLIVEVYHNGTLLPKDTDTSLGHMINGVIEAVVSIKNPGTEPISNVRVSKGKYFDYFGDEWVKIAEDMGGVPGAYQDEVFLGTLYPGETRNVWIKVTKQYSAHYRLIGSNKFLLQVTH